MTTIHVFPKGLNYLATGLSTEIVKCVYNFGANEDVLRALYVDDSAERQNLNHDEIFKIFETIHTEHPKTINIISTGLIRTKHKRAIVSIHYALVNEIQDTEKNKQKYVSGMIELETEIDSEKKHIDLNNVLSNYCELNVFNDKKSKYIHHQKITIFNDSTLNNNPFFDESRMHTTIMYMLNQSIDELRKHIYI